MMDELTTKMHGEFTVSPETEKRHVILAARTAMAQCGYTAAEAAKTYHLTLEELTQPQPAAH